MLIASGDWERALPAVVSREFLEEHGLELGDRFLTMVFWRLPWASYEIAAPLQAVASYKQVGTRATIYVPLAAYVKPGWIFEEEPEAEARPPANPRSAEELERTSRAKADALVSDAQAQADKIVAEAQAQAAELQKRFDVLKASAGSFKTEFSRMLDQQAAALKQAEELF